MKVSRRHKPMTSGPWPYEKGSKNYNYIVPFAILVLFGPYVFFSKMRNEEYIILHSRNNIITLGQEVVWIDGAFSLAAEPFQFASVQPIGTSFEVESIEKKNIPCIIFI